MRAVGSHGKHFVPGHTFLTPNLILPWGVSDRKNSSSHNPGNGIRGPFSIFHYACSQKCLWKLRKKPSEWIQGMSWIHTTQSRFEGRKAEEKPVSIACSNFHHHFQKKIYPLHSKSKEVCQLDWLFFGVGKTVGLEKTSNLFHLKKTNPHLKVQSTSRPAPMVVGKMSWQSAGGDYVGFTGN